MTFLLKYMKITLKNLSIAYRSIKDDNLQIQQYVLAISLPFPQFLIKHLYLLGTIILSNVHWLLS